MSLATPIAIRILQRKLYRKAKAEPAFRFYVLYDKICREDILRHAYALARANAGAPGVDEVTFAQIDLSGREAWLAGLREELISKTYRPSPVRRVSIPKPDGGERPLGIPTIRDRVVQTAAKLVLEPIFEADFEDNAYGYRPVRGAVDAVEEVQRLICRGHTDVVDADLSRYFDSIPHDELLKSVARRIADGAVLRLIKLWLKAPIEEQDDGDGTRRIGGGKSNTRGTPQGGVLTPRTQKITSAVLAIWLAGMRGWAAFGRSVGEGDRMADHDLIITHKDLFDQQAHDLLAIEDVESMQRSPEPAEECGECFGETEIGSAVGRLIGDRLQFAARGLFTLA